MSLLDLVNFGTGLGAIALQAISLVLLYSIWKPNRLGDFFRAHALWFALVIALASFVLSLYYSDIVGFAPCTLCWYQRILIYPQAILLVIALIKKDENVADYILALSAIGFVIALYNHYLQLGGASLIPCSANGSCAKRFVFEFGYVTIPLMALSGFLFNGLLMILRKKKTV